MSRRAALQSLLCAGLSACASDSGVPPTFKILSGLYDSVRSGGPTGYRKTPEQVRESHFACLGAQVGDGPKAILLLNAYDGDALRWISGDQVSLKTRSGRLLETAGLPRDLRSTDFVRMDPLAETQSAAALGQASTTWVMDLSEPDEYSLVTQSKFLVVGPETITIMDRLHRVIRVDESVAVNAWEWETVNRYWLDAETLFVWRSEQRFCKQLPMITLEVLKAPERKV